MTTATAVHHSITVAAPQARAFTTFTQGMSSWWPRSHKIGKAQLAEAIIEGREGGRWYERDVDGAECDWGKVLVWEPPARIVLAWQLSGEWAYDADLMTELEVAFVSVGPDETRVELDIAGSTPTASGPRRCATRSTDPTRGGESWRRSPTCFRRPRPSRTARTGRRRPRRPT